MKEARGEARHDTLGFPALREGQPASLTLSMVMSHHISGIVASSYALESIASAHGLGTPVQLDFEDLAFLTLDASNLDRLADVDFSGDAAEGFEFLTPSFAEWIRRCSVGRDLVYVETDYFGGVGVQAAIHFHDGVIAFGPAHAEIGPINQALIGLGVPDTPSADAFVRIGLWAYRNNGAFRRASVQRPGTAKGPGSE